MGSPHAKSDSKYNIGVDSAALQTGLRRAVAAMSYFLQSNAIPRVTPRKAEASLAGAHTRAC